MKEHAVLYLGEGVAMLVEDAEKLDAELAVMEDSADWLKEHAGMLKEAPKGVQDAMKSVSAIGLCPLSVGDCLGGAEEPEAPCLLSLASSEELWDVGEDAFAEDGPWTADVFFRTRTLEVCAIGEDGGELLASVKIGDIRKALAAGPADVESEDGVPQP